VQLQLKVENQCHLYLLHLQFFQHMERVVNHIWQDMRGLWGLVRQQYQVLFAQMDIPQEAKKKYGRDYLVFEPLEL
jgi:hypothetical protein